MKAKKVLKIFLIIILVLVVCFVVHFVRNMIILKKICKMQDDIQKMANYSYVMENNLGNMIKFTYKDGIRIEEIKREEGESVIFWTDENTGESIVYLPKEMKATKAKGTMAIQFGAIDSSNVFLLSIISHISSSEVNGEKCYLINFAEGERYISKERGIILKRKEVKTADDEYITVEYKDWKLGELTDEEVKRPDLTGYDMGEPETLVK